MKIIDILNQNRLSLSFEVFPPKTETAFESVKRAVEEIARLKPSFMSVTYGAGGGTSKYTLDIARNIKDRYGVPTLPKLCIRQKVQTNPVRVTTKKPSLFPLRSGFGLFMHFACHEVFRRLKRTKRHDKQDTQPKTGHRFLGDKLPYKAGPLLRLRLSYPAADRTRL